MAGTTNTETCECGHDRALHEGGYWACSAEGCDCVMVSGAPDHPTPPAPQRPIVVPITMVPARDVPTPPAPEAGHAACAFPCPECDPEHATPPAPGEAREAVCRWCGEPDAAHLLAENDESSCLLTLRARAAQAERWAAAWKEAAKVHQAAGRQWRRERDDAWAALTAATQDRDRLADALREADESLRRLEGTTFMPDMLDEIAHARGCIARAALAPRTRSTTTTTDETDQ